VPQEDLDEFLGVAHDLKIKGLTQNHEDEEDVKPTVNNMAPQPNSQSPLPSSATTSKRPASSGAAGSSQAKRRSVAPVPPLSRTPPAAEDGVMRDTNMEPSTSRLSGQSGLPPPPPNQAGSAAVNTAEDGGGYDDAGDYEEFEGYDEDGAGEYAEVAGGTGDDAAKGRENVTSRSLLIV